MTRPYWPIEDAPDKRGERPLRTRATSCGWHICLGRCGGGRTREEAAMSPGRRPGKSERNLRGIPTVGLFGNLGSGNIGNDASLEAMLRYLRTDHPDVILDAMCAGPEIVRRHYGIPALPIRSQHRPQHHPSVAPAVALKAVGK